jgi:hypothetical protein
MFTSAPYILAVVVVVAVQMSPLFPIQYHIICETRKGQGVQSSKWALPSFLCFSLQAYGTEGAPANLFLEETWVVVYPAEWFLGL